MSKIKLYVAYGSNLNLNQMKYRCPSSKIIGKGFINDHELIFKGIDNRAVATIQPKQNSKVPVLVWGITPKDELTLDIYEGYTRLYRKETIKVLLNNNEIVDTMIYLLNFGEPNHPSKRYYNIIKQGYLENKFDLTYLEKALKNSSFW